MVVAMDRAVHLTDDAVHRLRGFESLFKHRRASLDTAAMADIVCVVCFMCTESGGWERTWISPLLEARAHAAVYALHGSSSPCLQLQQTRDNQQFIMVSCNALGYGQNHSPQFIKLQ